MPTKTYTVTVTFASGDCDILAYFDSDSANGIGFGYASREVYVKNNETFTASWSGDVTSGGTETITLVSPVAVMARFTVHCTWFSSAGSGAVTVTISDGDGWTQSQSVTPTRHDGKALTSDPSATFQLRCVRAKWNAYYHTMVDDGAGNETEISELLYTVSGVSPLLIKVNDVALTAYNQEAEKKLKFKNYRFSYSGSKSPSFISPCFRPSYSIQNPADVSYSGTLSHWGVFEEDEDSDVDTYEVTVIASPEGGGSVSGEGIFSSGDVTFISQTPNTGYKFDGWKSSTGEQKKESEFSYGVLTTDITWMAMYSLIEDGSGNLIWKDK